MERFRGSLGESRRFGKGPYVKVDCPVNAAFTDKLAALVEQLRLATEEEQWAVDLQGFNSRCQDAAKAKKKKSNTPSIK